MSATPKPRWPALPTRISPTRFSPASATPSRTLQALDSLKPQSQDCRMEAAAPTAELSFEAALQRLEEIVRLLERGEAPLDKSIELYQEGDRLKRHCEARLKDAQARIEQIAFGSDGQPAGVKPFDAG